MLPENADRLVIDRARQELVDEIDLLADRCIVRGIQGNPALLLLRQVRATVECHDDFLSNVTDSAHLWRPGKIRNARDASP